MTMHGTPRLCLHCPFLLNTLQRINLTGLFAFAIFAFIFPPREDILTNYCWPVINDFTSQDPLLPRSKELGGAIYSQGTWSKCKTTLLNLLTGKNCFHIFIKLLGSPLIFNRMCLLIEQVSKRKTASNESISVFLPCMAAGIDFSVVFI